MTPSNLIKLIFNIDGVIFDCIHNYLFNKNNTLHTSPKVDIKAKLKRPLIINSIIQKCKRFNNHK
jgi:hypothetical protein